MVTYKEKTQTWKFGPPYPRRVYWIFEVSSLVPILVIMILFISYYIAVQFGIYRQPIMETLFSFQLSPVLLFVLLLFVGISVASYIYICMYSPKAIHLTYDEVVLMKGFWGWVKKRIPYDQIEKAELIHYSDESNFMPPSPPIIVNILEKLFRIDMKDKQYMIHIEYGAGKICDFQVEEPERFIRLIEEKMSEPKE